MFLMPVICPPLTSYKTKWPAGPVELKKASCVPLPLCSGKNIVLEDFSFQSNLKYSIGEDQAKDHSEKLHSMVLHKSV